MTLSTETRNAVRAACKQSAIEVLPVIFDTLGTPTALLDVGAGEGHWSAAALALHVPEVHALDLESHHRHGCTVYEWDARHDRLPLLHGDETWPLALCLEVAEHLDADTGDRLVRELCRVADEIIWSAAIPGQTGDGHINEQWPAYWAERFAEHGYALDDPWRPDLWSNPAVEPWYAQNLLLAYKHGVTIRVEGDAEDRPMRQRSPLAMVHPVTWAHHRGVDAP